MSKFKFEPTKYFWKVVKCKTPNCWCSLISIDMKKVLANDPIQPLVKADKDFKFIVYAGTLHTDMAKYFVKIHNEKLKSIK